MGRKRIYTDNKSRQAAFQEKKKEQKLIKESIEYNGTPSLVNIPELSKFPYTLEQMKEAYDEYRKLYIKAGFDIALRGDIDYIESHKKPDLTGEPTIFLAHGIPLHVMEYEIDNIREMNECPRHDSVFRFSIFLDYCPRCCRCNRGKLA